MYQAYFEKEYKKVKEYERLTSTTFSQFVADIVKQNSKAFARKESFITFLMMFLSFIFGLLFMLGLWTAFLNLGMGLFSIKGLLLILLPSLPVAVILLRWIFISRDDIFELAENKILQESIPLAEKYLTKICSLKLIEDCYIIHLDKISIKSENNRVASVKIREKITKEALGRRKTLNKRNAKQLLKVILEAQQNGVKNIKDKKLDIDSKKDIFKKYRRFMSNQGEEL